MPMIFNRFLAAVLIALTLAASARADEDTLFTTPGAAAGAFAAIVEMAGSPAQIHSVSIGPDAMVVLLQAGGNVQNLDRYEARYQSGWLSRAKSAKISGPSAARPSGPVSDLRGGYVPDSDIRLDLLSDTLTSAIAYTGIADPSVRITSVTIARHIVIMPNPGFADLRWRIEINNEREQATVTTGIYGAIIRADLGQTLRGRTLDARIDGWVAPLVVAELGTPLGDTPVYQVRFLRQSVIVKADHPTDPDLSRDYIWRLGSVTRGIVDTMNVNKLLARSPLPRFHGAFAFGDLDLSLAHRLGDKARVALQMPGGTVDDIIAERPDSRDGLSPIEWRVKIRLGGSVKEVSFTQDGKLIE